MKTLEKLERNGICVEYQEIFALCNKYKIREFSVFGSSLREDFNENSDVDILVSFFEDAPISLFDLIDLQNELEKMLNRKVDLIEKEALKNPIRKKSILESMEIIYAA